jgi:hypothetical protein
MGFPLESFLHVPETIAEKINRSHSVLGKGGLDSVEGMTLEQKVNSHDIAINEEILPRLANVERDNQDSIKRMNVLEENMKSQKEQMTTIEKSLVSMQLGQKDLETTVLKNGQSNTELQMQSQNMIQSLLQIVGSKNESEAQVALKKSEVDAQVTVKKLDTKQQIIIALISGLCGAGGLAGIFVAIQTWFPGG